MDFSHLSTLPKYTRSLSTQLCFFRTPQTVRWTTAKLFQWISGAGDKQSEGAFSPSRFPDTYLLLEDFHSGSWAEGGGGGSPAPEHRFAEFDRQAVSDLRGFSEQDAGASREAEGRERTAHVTQLHFQVAPRDPAGVGTDLPPLDCLTPRDPIKTPKF